MSFTLGRDLGIVMSKGVILGVLGTVTAAPVRHPHDGYADYQDFA